MTSIRPGRVSLKYSKDAAASGTKRTSSQHRLTDPVLAPEEVLFSRKHAPQRYAEKDIYFAHEDLPHAGRDVLPDSDLLKAVHGYASHFYEALGRRRDGGEAPSRRAGGRRVDERSLDETALLAFGILLEEAARESLGRNGDLVFTEGVEDDADGDGDAESELNPRRGAARGPAGFEGEEFWKRKYSKRRKVEEDSG